MLRKQLSAALEQAAQQAGYGFYRGFGYRAGEVPVHFPALWLLPPEMIRIDGRCEGEAAFSVTMHLMHPNRKYGEADKETLWDTMERDALRMIRGIGAMPGVFCTENIRTAPAEFSLTRHGELSLRAQFDARLYFINTPEIPAP